MIGAAVLALLLLPSVASWSFKVTMSARLEGDEMPLVVGATNLPDGTALIVTLQRKESRYMAQAKTGVTSGAFRAGPFSQEGRASESRCGARRGGEGKARVAHPCCALRRLPRELRAEEMTCGGSR